MASNHGHSTNHDSHGEQHHITPFSVYIKVAGGLFLLTFLTIGFHQLPLGVLKAPVAFLIAAVKAWLVIWYFMHLNHDKPLNRFTFATGFFFLFLLFVICATDIWTRVVETSTL